MQSQVDAELDCSAQVEYHDVLRVRAGSERIGGGRAFVVHASEAALEGIEFAGNYQRIHACLRSASMRFT